MKRYEHNPVPCGGCGQDLEFARPLSHGHGNLDGNYSVCSYCGHVAVFTVTDGQVGLREPNEAEMDYFQVEYGYFIRLFKGGKT